MIKKITFLSALAIMSLSAKAQSFSALYSFDSLKTTSGLNDPTPVPTATGVTFGHFSATGTSTNPNASGRFSYTNWPLGATSGNDLFSSLTGAINTSEYFEVTVTPSPGFTMTLSSITFKSQRSGTGVRTYSVRSNADAYATNLTASISPANTQLSVQTGNIFFRNYDSTTTSLAGNTINLSGSNFTNTSGAKTFRFYAWNAEGTGGTFSIDTVKINGSVTGATSITSLSPESAISVYPNPSANGLFTVDLVSNGNKTILSVYNIIGKIIVTKELSGTGKQELDLSSEANGIYFITVKNENSTLTKKIIINK